MTHDNVAPILLNRREAAQALSVSVATLDRLVRSGDIRTVDLTESGCRRFRPEDLKAFVDSRAK